MPYISISVFGLMLLQCSTSLVSYSAECLYDFLCSVADQNIVQFKAYKAYNMSQLLMRSVLFYKQLSSQKIIKHKLMLHQPTFLPISPKHPQSPSSDKKMEQQTSHQIPQSSQNRLHQLPKQTAQFLSKSNIVSTITAVVSTQLATKFVRTMLLQARDHEDISAQQCQSDTRVFQKMFTAHSQRGDTFNWLYFQAVCAADRSYAYMIASVSCTIIYELTDIETDGKYLQQYVQNHKKITGKNPLLFCISTPFTSDIALPTLSISYQHISVPQDWPTSETSALQNLFQTGRKIINESQILQNNKEIPISCAVLPHFFTKWQEMCNGKLQQAKQEPLVIWNQAVFCLDSAVKNQCIGQYRARMGKLYEDKKFISIKLLRNSHQISAQIAMKSIQKYKITNENLSEELESMINQELNKILQQIMEINLTWGKSFIQSEFLQMENRLKSKDFKLLSSLKQEFNMFIDYFHKKAEPLGCKKLQYFFQQFVVDKAFDFSIYIFESDKKNVHLELSETRSKLQQKQAEIKELKRQITKQSAQSSKTIQSLQQSMILMKNRSQLLQSTISQLKADKQFIENQGDMKISELQKAFLMEMSQYRQQRANLSQQLSTAKRRIAQLQSDIEKEKQMHSQSCQHYQLLIENLKCKEEELKQQIQEITMRTSQELETMKRDSERSLNQSSIHKSQKQKEGAKLIQQLNQINRKYSQLQKCFSNLQYEMQLKKAEQQVSNNDIEIALKLAQQQILQYESRQHRYEKLQQQIEAYQNQQQQLHLEQKKYEKQTALLKQQNSFISQQMQELQSKYMAEKQNCAELKGVVEGLQEKVGKMDKVKVNQWVQTDGDGKMKAMLEEAYQIVSVLETQYGKLKMENNKLRYQLGQF